MKTRKIYLETTIFNYYFDNDRMAHPATVKLFNEIKEKKFEAYTSSYVVDELLKAQEPRQSAMINLINKYGIILLPKNNETFALANKYIEGNIIPKGSVLDAQHIACASINNINCVISLNFTHINRAKTKELVPYVNKQNGYNSDISIFSPMEVIENEE